jgi:hypothetical protein
MNTTSEKPQTFRKVIFTDSSFVRIIHNLDPEPGEPIIDHIQWLHGNGTWPAEIIDAILSVWQWHSDFFWKSFEQSMTLPSGRVICWRFHPQEPCAVCLQSEYNHIAEGLFDAPPSKPVPAIADDYRTEVLEAIMSRISPERMAEVFAGLPTDSQRRVAAKCFVETNVRRTVKFTRRSKK